MVRAAERVLEACLKHIHLLLPRCYYYAQFWLTPMGYRSKKAIAPMAMLRRRSRLVTFRVSPEEYEALMKSCMDCGDRSIADFARAAALQRVRTLDAPPFNLSGDLMTLTKGLRDLDSALAEIRGRIRGVLGPGSSAVGAGAEERNED
jgi:hypothetical protein